jgi:hypothetical protein
MQKGTEYLVVTPSLSPSPPTPKKEIKDTCKCDYIQSTILNSYLIHCDHLKLNSTSLKKGVGGDCWAKLFLSMP